MHIPELFEELKIKSNENESDKSDSLYNKNI